MSLPRRIMERIMIQFRRLKNPKRGPFPPSSLIRVRICRATLSMMNRPLRSPAAMAIKRDIFPPDVFMRWKAPRMARAHPTAVQVPAARYLCKVFWESGVRCTLLSCRGLYPVGGNYHGNGPPARKKARVGCGDNRIDRVTFRSSPFGSHRPMRFVPHHILRGLSRRNGGRFRPEYAVKKAGP